MNQPGSRLPAAVRDLAQTLAPRNAAPGATQRSAPPALGLSLATVTSAGPPLLIALGGSSVVIGGTTGVKFLGSYTPVTGDLVVVAKNGSDLIVLGGLVAPGGLPSGAILLATQQTGTTYTFALSDLGTVVEGNNAGPQTFTIAPHSSVPSPLGAILEVFQLGAGQITVAAGAGVTFLSDGGKVKTAAQYASIGLRQRAIDTWVLTGDLA